MIADDDRRLRAEHDAVLQRVSKRLSIDHLAHGIVAMAVGGGALALGWDLWGQGLGWELQVSLGALMGSLGILGYAGVRLVLAWVTARREAADVARLLELRQTLGLDTPGALLPR